MSEGCQRFNRHHYAVFTLHLDVTPWPSVRTLSDALGTVEISPVPVPNQTFYIVSPRCIGELAGENTTRSRPWSKP